MRYKTECRYLASSESSKKRSVGSASCSPSTAEGSHSAETEELSRVHAAPAIGLMVTPSSDLNIADLELLHHYVTSTCFATNQKVEVTTQLQIAVPTLAQAHPFLMHGILAQAATHLSRLRPSMQAHYSATAKRHRYLSLPDFRSELSKGICADNYLPLVFYSKKLLWCAMAAGNEKGEDGGCDTPTMGHSDWLPSWFHLLRGSCYIVQSSKSWIPSEGVGLHSTFCGPQSAVQISNAGREKNLQLYEDQVRLTQLSSYLLRALRYSSPSASVVLSTLQEAFVCASLRDQNTPLRNALNLWVGSLPVEFVTLLRDKEPWSLVVLAHFAVLLHRSETVWFMKGRAVELLVSIVKFLPSEWLEVIQWPCEELGIR
jgi:hypothetical protein